MNNQEIIRTVIENLPEEVLMKMGNNKKTQMCYRVGGLYKSNATTKDINKFEGMSSALPDLYEGQKELDKEFIEAVSTDVAEFAEHLTTNIINYTNVKVNTTIYEILDGMGKHK